MIGQSPEMQTILSTMQKVATSNASVLIQGERGTGKELIARGIYALSHQKDGPFVRIDCSSTSEMQLQSELYDNGKHGKLEYDNNRTVFLDEIGDLSSPLQLKLLRFLEDYILQQKGGKADVVLGTRIIAATSRDLLKEIGAGIFREELFYQIGVVLIKVPPLRERTGDIVALATYFLNRYCESNGKRLRGFNSAALDSIETYDWPGNVRELENKIQRAIVLSEGPLVESHDLGFDVKPVGKKPVNKEMMTLKEAKDRVEKEMVVTALDKYAGNIAKAAEALGTSRPTLYDIMKKHGLFSPTEDIHNGS